MMTIFHLLAVGVACAASAPPRSPAIFTNPLDVKVADPCIIRVGATYYLYGTASRPADANLGIPVWSSTDLVVWRSHGFAFRRTADTWGQQWFWGPDVKRSGKKFLLYYGAFHRIDGKPVGRICVAEADHPLGPFRDVKAPMFAWKGRGNAIDAYAFEDADGKGYLYFTDALDGRNTIWIARIAADGLSLVSEPRLILQPDQPWEVQPVNEGAFVCRHDSRYYLLYSFNDFRNPAYGVGLATATQPLGPWTKRTAGPVIRQTPELRGPGCAGLIDSPDGKELWAYYHVHLGSEGYVRQLALSRARYLTRDGRVELRIDPPAIDPQPLPSGAPPPPRPRSDAFRSGQLDRRLWHIVDEDPGSWRCEKGVVSITARAGDMWRTRTDYRNVFLQPAVSGDFAVSVEVEAPVQNNFEQAFLIAWQDADNYVRLSKVYANAPEISAAIEIQGSFEEVLVPMPVRDDVILRLERHGDVWTFAVGDGTKWTPVGSPREARFAAPRLGFGAMAPGSKRPFDARFRDFRVRSPLIPEPGPQ